MGEDVEIRLNRSPFNKGISKRIINGVVLTKTQWKKISWEVYNGMKSFMIAIEEKQV